MSLPETVEIKVDTLSQLFSPLDPSPLPGRDLAPSVEEHLVGWVRDLSRDDPLQIVVHLAADAARDPLYPQASNAMNDYFAARAKAAEREMKELFRTGRRYLAIGLPLLVICLVASQLVRDWLGPGAVSQLVSESLVILPWVANWKPIELFLYDWWPIRRRRNLFRRLQQADVEIKAL